MSKRTPKIVTKDGVLYLVLQRLDGIENRLTNVEKQVTNHIPTSIKFQKIWLAVGALIAPIIVLILDKYGGAFIEFIKYLFGSN